MNDQTVTAYRQLDAQAGNYADLEQAIATAKRRRRRTVAAVSATPLVIAGLLGAIVAGPPVAPDPTSPPAASPGQSVRLSDPRVIQPPTRRHPLPPTPTGRAALAYEPCMSGCDAFVVLNDGRQFVAPSDAPGVTAGALSLSPDGGWLGYPMSDGYLVRDLSGARVHRLGGGFAAAVWSADSSRLLVFDEPPAGGDATYQLLDLGTGQLTAVSGPPGAQAVGVLPDGAVLFSTPDQTGPVRVFTTSTGQRFTVNLAGHLQDGELTYVTRLASDGISVYLVVRSGGVDVTAAAPQPVAVIQVALAGKVLGRFPLPTSDDPNWFWQPLGASPDGFVFDLRADRGKGTVTTLVTVSAAGFREGVVIPAGHQGGVTVRIPG